MGDGSLRAPWEPPDERGHVCLRCQIVSQLSEGDRQRMIFDLDAQVARLESERVHARIREAQLTATADDRLERIVELERAAKKRNATIAQLNLLLRARRAG